MRIKGIRVLLHQQVPTGRDAFGHAIYEDVPEEVDNVLVAPVSSSESPSSSNVRVSHTQYNLAIPKGDTHEWRGAEVEFYGKRWKTVGEPVEGIEENIPLSWNMKVTVERYE